MSKSGHDVSMSPMFEQLEPRLMLSVSLSPAKELVGFVDDGPVLLVSEFAPNTPENMQQMLDERAVVIEQTTFAGEVDGSLSALYGYDTSQAYSVQVNEQQVGS